MEGGVVDQGVGQSLGPVRAEAVVEAVYAIVKRQIGILSMSDVTVVRPEHF